MKRLRLVPILIVPAVVLGLAACSSSGSGTNATASASASASTAASGSCPTTGSAAKAIKVTGGTVGSAAPTVTPGGGSAPSTAQAITVTKGNGPKVKSVGSAQVAYAVYDAKTGDALGNVGYGDGDPGIIDLSSASTAAFPNELTCSREGDRFAMVGKATSLGFSGTASYIVVGEILDTPLKASGTTETPQAGFPTVKVAANGQPTVTTKGVTAPASTQTEVLVKGDGAAVASGDSVLVQYQGVYLSSGKVFDSSWKRGVPSVFPTVASGSLIDGFVTGLTGQTVGSRVVIVIPSAEGYGATPPSGSGIPANADLVFVVDILAKATASS